MKQQELQKNTHYIIGKDNSIRIINCFSPNGRELGMVLEGDNFQACITGDSRVQLPKPELKTKQDKTELKWAKKSFKREIMARNPHLVKLGMSAGEIWKKTLQVDTAKEKSLN